MKTELIPTRILTAVRQRLGAKDENDISMDKEIIGMNPRELVSKWTGWVLGDEGWGHMVIDYYESLKIFTLFKDTASSREI